MAQIRRPYCTGAATAAGNAAWVRLPHCAQEQTWARCSVTTDGRGSGRSNTWRAVCHVAIIAVSAASQRARWRAQAPGPRRLLQPIARWWLATVAAVEAEPALQLGDPALQAFNQLLQRGVLGQQPLDVRFQGIFGFARRIGPIRRLSHWQLDSRRYPSRQAISSRTWAVTRKRSQWRKASKKQRLKMNKGS